MAWAVAARWMPVRNFFGLWIGIVRICLCVAATKVAKEASSWQALHSPPHPLLSQWVGGPALPTNMPSHHQSPKHQSGTWGPNDESVVWEPKTTMSRGYQCQGVCMNDHFPRRRGKGMRVWLSSCSRRERWESMQRIRMTGPRFLEGASGSG
jgi:hypothetical protein